MGNWSFIQLHITENVVTVSWFNDTLFYNTVYHLKSDFKIFAEQNLPSIFFRVKFFYFIILISILQEETSLWWILIDIFRWSNVNKLIWSVTRKSRKFVSNGLGNPTRFRVTVLCSLHSITRILIYETDKEWLL